jgi:hypothetical protein
MQTLLPAMTAYGVASCPQGLLGSYTDTVRDQLGVDEGKPLVGISFGYADENAPVNRVATGRAALAATTTFHSWNRSRPCWSQPLVEDCDQHGRLMSDGEFVVSRGPGAVPFQPVDPVAFPVVVLVEGRWPAAPSTRAARPASGKSEARARARPP